MQEGELTYLLTYLLTHIRISRISRIYFLPHYLDEYHSQSGCVSKLALSIFLTKLPQ
jgi:hypothetical protein